MLMFFPILWPLDGYKFGESSMDFFFFFSQRILCISLPWSEMLKFDWQCLMTMLLIISLWYPSLCGFKLFTASVKQAACRQSQTLRGFSAEHKAILASNFFQHYLPESLETSPPGAGDAISALLLACRWLRFLFLCSFWLVAVWGRSQGLLFGVSCGLREAAD